MYIETIAHIIWIAKNKLSITNKTFKMSCPLYCPNRMGHTHILPPSIGPLENKQLPIKITTSQLPQHEQIIIWIVYKYDQMSYTNAIAIAQR